MKIGERAKDAIYIFALFVLTIIFFEQMIFHNKILLLRDLYCDYIPWRTFARESIRNGIMPLWNPYSSLGQPFIAFPQTAVFYPLNLMFYVLPIITALRWFIVLHIFLAGVFMYILMKHWNVARIAAFVSAIIFMFNGMIISRLEFLTIISTLVWIPLLFYLLDIAIEKSSLWCSIVTGIVLSIQLLAGHPQTFYYAYLSLGLYWIVKITIRCFTTRDIKSIIKLGFVLPLATIIAISLSMIQLLPTLELTNLSIRAENYNPQMHEASLHPFHLSTFLIPYLFGIPGYANVYWGISQIEFWTGSFYVGIFTLILILLSTIFIFCKKNELSNTDTSLNLKDASNNFRILTAFFCALTMLLIILASGVYTPIYNIFYTYFPFFNKFRWPSRIMELTVFSLSIIAGIGAHYFFISVKNTKNLQSKKTDSCLYLVLKIIIITDALLIAFFLLGYFMPAKMFPLIKGYINMVHFVEIPTSLESRYSLTMRGFLYMLIFLNAGIILFFLGIARKVDYKVLKFLLPLVIVIDLFFMFKGLNYYSSADVYITKPDVITYLESDKDLFRIGSTYNKTQQFLYGIKTDSAFLRAKSVLAGETSLPYHIFKLLGGGELKINNYVEFLNYLNNKARSLNIQNNILKLLNVKFIFTGEKDEILLNNDSTKVTLSKYVDYYPRVFVVGKTIVLNNKTDLLGKLFSEDFDLFKEIIIEDQKKDVGNLPFEKKEINYKIKKLDYLSNKVKIAIELDNNGFLVLSDTYYPGWKAYIDNKETTIYKTDYILQSVFLEKGSHNVEFIYDPISFKIGYIITLSTTFVLIIIGILKYRNYTVKKVSNSKVC